MEDAYARSVSEVLHFFAVDPTKGLTDLQVTQHARLYGKNVLPQEKSTPFWKLVLKQFDDLLVKILIAAAFISFSLALVNGETVLSAFIEPSVILMILAANAAVGVITETNAEKALEELRAYQADIATVLRNGCFSILPATDLVPGDIVEVSVGCKIPADMRMIEILSDHLRVDQAILTGSQGSVAVGAIGKRQNEPSFDDIFRLEWEELGYEDPSNQSHAKTRIGSHVPAKDMEISASEVHVPAFKSLSNAFWCCFPRGLRIQP